MTITMSGNTFAKEHDERKRQLRVLIQRYLKVLARLAQPDEEKKILVQDQCLQEDLFRVLVLGEFSRGKSTLINAILGEELLFSSPLEATAFITVIKWGSEKHAKLYKNGGGEPTVLRGPELKKLDTYLRVDHKSKQENPYVKAEIYWPLDFCKNGVEFIDSPGLNVVSEVRMKHTYDYLPTADAVIFLTDCQAAGGASEHRTLKLLKDHGHETIFIACTKFDHIRPKEREEIRQHLIELFTPFTKPGYVFFLNSLGALDARIDGNLAALDATGFPLFEKKLQSFLINERGNIKLLHPAIEVRTSIHRTQENINNSEFALRESYVELQKKVQQAEKDLNVVEHSRENIKSNIESFRSNKLHRIVREAAQGFYVRQLDKIDGWAIEHQMGKSLGVLSSQEDRVEAAQEIQDDIAERLKDEFRAWEKNTLSPLIEREFNAYSSELSVKIRRFAEDFEQIRAATLSGASQSNQTIDERAKKLMEDIIVQTTGGSTATEKLDNKFGFGQVMKLLLPQGGILGALTLLFGWHPFIFIPLVTLTAIFSFGKYKEKLVTKMKEEVAQEYRKNLALNARELSTQVADAVSNSLEDFQNRLDETLESTIQNFRNTLHQALETQRQQNVDQKLRDLTQSRNELNILTTQLEGMISDFRQTRVAI